MFQKDNLDEVWATEVSNEVKSLISLADELKTVPWENTGIPSDNVYFSEPNPEVFSIMHKQLVSILLVRIIALLKENKTKGIYENVINHILFLLFLRIYTRWW